MYRNMLGIHFMKIIWCKQTSEVIYNKFCQGNIIKMGKKQIPQSHPFLRLIKLDLKQCLNIKKT